MSLPDHNNPYSFDEFLAWRRNVDYYRDDPFIQSVVRHFVGNEWETVDAEARAFSVKASFRWRDFSESIAYPDKRPTLMQYDGYHNRIDRIVRPREMETMEREVLSEAMFSGKTSPWVRLIKMYLLYQNGEAGVACPITGTEGLIRLLEKLSDTPETGKILKHCKEGINGEFGSGAMYLTEIQGGSDVASNVLEAKRDGDVWRLFGAKFFCSATHADYAVVTAKPQGSDKVAVFVVPSWLPGDREKEIRNGHTIDRLKWKMGTSEVTTGELTFNGAIAYPLGSLDKGLANVVGLVLTHARLIVGLGAGAYMTRAVREAKKYAEFRLAFGMPIGRFPMVAGQLSRMEHATQRTVAGAFKIYRDFLALEGGLKAGLQKNEADKMRKQRFNIRELIMLQKITATWDCTDIIREAISIFGGNGVIEDFSSLPRLYRDSAVNELWEGPRNVLLTQIHRDMQCVIDWYSPSDFVGNILDGLDPTRIDELGREMSELLSHDNLFQMDDKTVDVCLRWDAFCHNLFHAYQDLSLQELGKT